MNAIKITPLMGALTIFFCLSGARASSARELTRDDVDFRKSVYANPKGEHMPYRLFVPLGYSPSTKYPLVLWLHGGEGRGSDNVRQIVRGNELGTHTWITSENQAKFPAFVLAPQCPQNDSWSDPELNLPGKPLLLALEILASVQKEFSIDPDRVYVVGQSIGGLGVWSLLQKYPEKWAGAVILCSYDTFSNPEVIGRVPLWVFQGDEDRTVPVTMVRDMMKQLRKLHANLRYTEYHKADHDIWTRVFAEPELVPWLAAQRREASAGGQVGTGSGAAKP